MEWYSRTETYTMPKWLLEQVVAGGKVIPQRIAIEVHEGYDDVYTLDILGTVYSSFIGSVNCYPPFLTVKEVLENDDYHVLFSYTTIKGEDNNKDVYAYLKYIRGLSPKETT